MENKNTVIEMKHIVKDFNGFKANNDINLKLHKGEILHYSAKMVQENQL